MIELMDEKRFMQDAIKAYGEEDAMILCHSLIYDLNDANLEIPLIEPVVGYKLAITDKVSKEVGIRAFAGKAAIELLFSPDADINSLVYDLTKIVYHETGHIAHRQRNPQLSSSPDLYLFSGVVKEGIAVQTESLPHGYYASLVAMEERGDIRAEAALQTLLDEPGDDQRARYYEYIIGDQTFPCRGYAIGHYLVESMRIHQDRSLVELM